MSKKTKSCCGPECCSEAKPATQVADQDVHRDQVRAGYAKIANDGWWSAALADANVAADSKPFTGAKSSCAGGGCCGPATFTPQQLAEAIGYAQADLVATPDNANMGLSCGNPTAIASLELGEVVIDLGSGGGFDVFIAGRKVGATGRAIGVDMTPEMLGKARRNIAGYQKETDLDNVEFRLGEIEHLPVADNSVDAIISNCVINLSPDKAQVWREIARVLKPGGRVAVSDMALVKPLPAKVLTIVEALVGCVAGAALVSETGRMAREAGLSYIMLKVKSDYIEAMLNFEDSLYQKIIELLPAGAKPSDYITSLEVQALKPKGDCCGNDCCE